MIMAVGEENKISCGLQPTFTFCFEVKRTTPCGCTLCILVKLEIVAINNKFWVLSGHIEINNI